MSPIRVETAGLRMNEILFYGLTSRSCFRPQRSLGVRWRAEFILPRISSLASKRLVSKFSLGCWALHTTKQFANQDCGLLTLSDGRVIASYCWAHPGFFRYPFMATQDLQVGKVFTHPDYRGNGLAAAGVSELVHRCTRPGRTIWYLTSKENPASIRVAEKLGFELRGRGGIRARWGTQALGGYEINIAEPPSRSHLAG